MKPFKPIIRKHVPNVASHPSNIVFIDSRLVKKFPRARIHTTYHENAERILMNVHRWPYSKAHKRADQLERKKFFKGKSKEWHKYNREVAKLHKSTNKYLKRKHGGKCRKRRRGR